MNNIFLSKKADGFHPLRFYFFFFLFLTASVRINSICPLIDRKSSSAQSTISFHKVGDKRRSNCFLSSFNALSFLSDISKSNPNLQPERHLYCHREPPADSKPSALFSHHPVPQHFSRTVCLKPFPPYRPHLQRFSDERR